MLSSVSFSVLSVSVQRIIKWDPLNYKTQICLALFLRTYTQRSSLQPQARSDLTRTRIHQSHKTRMKIVELTWQMSNYMSIRRYNWMILWQDSIIFSFIQSHIPY